MKSFVPLFLSATLPAGIRKGGIVFVAVLLQYVGVAGGCGFDKCTPSDPEAVNVHMVSHSHDDVGWVRTVDEYYNDQVRYILDTVIDALNANPKRKFIQVETAYFYKWWIRQPQWRKNQTIALAERGQLEFAGGAWSMNDEGSAHYQSIIDSFTLGFRFLNDTIGQCGTPAVGWQIDPFGHSRQMANLFSEMAFQGIFFGRLDYRDKWKRMLARNMEILWRGNPTLGNESDIFTSVLFNLYQPPKGFCFDVLCGDRIDKGNERIKVSQFIATVEEMAKAYKTNNILITMGGDFTYSAAEYYFNQIDFLIKSIKNRYHKKFNIFYSTPACYLHSVRRTGHKLKVKTNDFFPYADKANAYWTGYYTSRPTSKRFEREGNYYLQTAKQLSSLAGTSNNTDVFELSNAMGIMQHHDAITGTEQQYVAEDYARILDHARAKVVTSNSDRLKSLMGIDLGPHLHYVECSLGNMSLCNATDSVRFVVALYNPLGYIVSQHVRLPVKYSKYSVWESISVKIQHQISLPQMHFRPWTLDKLLPYELTFLAEDIPPLGVKHYLVTIDDQSTSGVIFRNIKSDDQMQLGTPDLGVELDSRGSIKTLFNREVSLRFRQHLMYYNSREILGSWGRPSGAYIFSPAGDAEHFHHINCTVFSGPVFDEIRQDYAPWVQQIVRIYRDKKKYIEFDWIVGPIEYGSPGIQGTEIVSRFETSINSGSDFRTDTNGRGEILRTRNFRKSYDYTSDDNIAGNYYPITSHISIQNEDAGTYLSVFTDRAQGGSSLKSGELELMLHRRLVDDDSLGVGETLNEMDPLMGAIARGQHILKFGRVTSRDDQSMSREILLKPIANFLQIPLNDNVAWKLLDKKFSGLTRELPKDVHLLTLEPFKLWENKLLIRLEHINENGFPTYVDFSNLFSSFQVVDVTEMTLGANIYLDGRYGDDSILKYSKKYRNHKVQHSFDFTVHLRPTEIRTFLIQVIYFNPQF